MSRKWWWKPSIRELSVEELGQLLHLSHSSSRESQSEYLKCLGGEGSWPELDYMLSVARNKDPAVAFANQLDQERNTKCFPGSKRVSKAICDAVSFFTHQAISGEFGPDDSRDSRSYAFLKHNHVIPRAVTIFLENLLIDSDGNVLNHDEAEERGAEYIRHNC